jgi:hypothetical protein
MKIVMVLGTFVALAFATFSFTSSDEETCGVKQRKQQSTEGCGGGALVCCASTALNFR